MSKTRLPKLKSLCIFCGSSAGIDPRQREAAERLGSAMARQGVQLVYGGGQLGLMGALAEAVMTGGGRVVGIIPEHLTRVERAYVGVTELQVVDGMHTRKRRMFDLADAFVTLPGGMGTLDETFEILTWRQLHLHHKPIILVNQYGYWQPWLDLAGHIIGQGFARPDTAALFSVVDDVDEVLPAARSGVEKVAGRETDLF
jgi:uncharacterized protein (TIGR00730 family)